MARKICPFCEKPTTTRAMKCRRCGAPLQELLLANDSIHERPRGTVSWGASIKVCLYFLIVLLAGICGIAAMVPKIAPSYRPAQTDTSAPYQTTAANLYQNYTAYEAAAELTPGTSAIEISGTVNSVGRNLFDETEVVLDAGGKTKSVTVTLDQVAGRTAESGLYEGAHVVVRCENMSRIIDPPTGQTCQLLLNKDGPCHDLACAQDRSN